MFYFNRFIVSIAFVLGLCSHSFAREGCNRHCLEKIYSQFIVLEDKVKNAIPIGTILPYSGSGSLPQGYLPCDGSAVDQVKYRGLFEVIGLSFTLGAPAAQPGAAHPTFQLPDLKGRGPVGANELRALGTSFGSETQRLTVAHLPPHQHGGTTDFDDRDHSHSGRTGDDGPDHSHNYETRTGTVPIYNGVPLNHAGSNHSIGANTPVLGTGHGANQRHQHDFTTGNQNTKHQHLFVTDDGTNQGLRGEAFFIAPPALAVRYMIKAE